MFGAIVGDLDQIFVGDAAQLPAQRLRSADGIELGMLVDDRLDGVDVMGDQFGRHLLELGGVLDDPAQAVRNVGGGSVTEGRGIALDVMYRAKQLFAGSRVEAVLEDRGV